MGLEDVGDPAVMACRDVQVDPAIASRIDHGRPAITTDDPREMSKSFALDLFDEHPVLLGFPLVAVVRVPGKLQQGRSSDSSRQIADSKPAIDSGRLQAESSNSCCETRNSLPKGEIEHSDPSLAGWLPGTLAATLDRKRRFVSRERHRHRYRNRHHNRVPSVTANWTGDADNRESP